MRCVLVSCCGLPAAGKTTFCRSVATDPVAMPTTASSRAPSAATAPPGAQMEELGANVEADILVQVRVSHVCFDEYIDRAHNSRESNSPSGTRANPDPVLGDSDESTDPNQAAEMAPRTENAAVSGDGARLWHEGRRAALAEVEALASAQDEDTSAVKPRSGDRRKNALAPEAPAAVHVVLVDDNMHFRTMRREVFSLARRCACVYMCVCGCVDVFAERHTSTRYCLQPISLPL